MILFIEDLITKDNAYVSEGHVLFDINSYKSYGDLSSRDPKDMIAGSRVKVQDYKKNPLDFVLWKPSNENEIDKYANYAMNRYEGSFKLDRTPKLIDNITKFWREDIEQFYPELATPL